MNFVVEETTVLINRGLFMYLNDELKYENYPSVMALYEDAFAM